MSHLWPLPLLLLAVTTCRAGETEWREATNEPGAAKIWLHPGVPIGTVLESLNSKGFRISYNPEQLPPTMTLLERPKARRIDTLLREILTPYDLHADHTPYGEWKVKPMKKSKRLKQDEKIRRMTAKQ
jgi:hypothetical protein